MVLIFVLNFAAAGGAFAWGYLQDRIGHKIALGSTLVGWIATCVIAALSVTKGQFWWAAGIACDVVCLTSADLVFRALQARRGAPPPDTPQDARPPRRHPRKLRP